MVCVCMALVSLRQDMKGLVQLLADGSLWHITDDGVPLAGPGPRLPVAEAFPRIVFVSGPPHDVPVDMELPADVCDTAADICNTAASAQGLDYAFSKFFHGGKLNGTSEKRFRQNQFQEYPFLQSDHAQKSEGRNLNR